MQAIGHQLAHVLLGHRGVPTSESPFPHVDPSATAAVAFTRYAESEESAADEFAARLIVRVNVQPTGIYHLTLEATEFADPP